MKHFVKMPIGAYIGEHKRLIRLLNQSDKPQLKREAKKQNEEVKRTLKKL